MSQLTAVRPPDWFLPDHTPRGAAADENVPDWFLPGHAPAAAPRPAVDTDLAGVRERFLSGGISARQRDAQAYDVTALPLVAQTYSGPTAQSLDPDERAAAELVIQQLSGPRPSGFPGQQLPPAIARDPLTGAWQLADRAPIADVEAFTRAQRTLTGDPTLRGQLTGEGQRIQQERGKVLAAQRVNPLMAPAAAVGQLVQQQGPRSLPEEAVAATFRGTANMWEGAAGTLQELGIAPQTAKSVGDVAQALQAGTPRSQLPPDAGAVEKSAYYLTNLAGEQAPQLMSQAGLSMLPGVAPAAMAGRVGAATRFALFAAPTFASESGQAFRGALERGESETTARAEGIVYGTVATALERLPAGEYFNHSPVFRRALRKVGLGKLAPAVQAAIAGSQGEGAEEALQQLAQRVVQYAYERDPEAFKDLPRELYESYLGGAVLGGAMGPVMDRAHIPEQTAEPVQQPAQRQRQQGQGADEQVQPDLEDAPLPPTPPTGDGRQPVGPGVAVGREQVGQVVGADGQAPQSTADAAEVAKNLQELGRADAAEGYDRQDLSDQPAEVRRLYEIGYREGLSQRRTRPAAAAPSPAPIETTPAAEPAAAEPALPPAGTENDATTPPAPAGAGPELVRHPLPAVVLGRRLDDLSNAELRAVARDRGIREAKSRPSLIGRLRAAGVEEELLNGRRDTAPNPTEGPRAADGADGRGARLADPARGREGGRAQPVPVAAPGAARVEPRADPRGGAEAAPAPAGAAPVRPQRGQRVADAERKLLEAKAALSFSRLQVRKKMVGWNAEARTIPEKKAAVAQARAELREAKKAERPTIEQRLNAAEQKLRAEMGKGGALPRTGGAKRGRPGGTTLPSDLVNLAGIAAIRVAKAGIKTGKAVAEVVQTVARELGRALTPDERQAVTREAIRISNAAGEGGESIDRALQESRQRHGLDGPAAEGSTKSQVITNTGQRDEADAKTVTERQALKASQQARERGSREGFKAGVAEGRAQAVKPKRETVKQLVARTTGLTDSGDAKTISRRQALLANLKAQAKAANVAAVTARQEAIRELTLKTRELMQQRDQTSKEARQKLARLVRTIAPPALHARFLNAIATTRTERQADVVAARLLTAVESYQTREAVRAADKAAAKAGKAKLVEELQGPVDAASKEIDRLKAELQAAKDQAAAAEAKLAGYLQALRQINDQARRASRRQRIETELLTERLRLAESMADVRAKLVEQQQVIIAARTAQRRFDLLNRHGRSVEREQVVNEILLHLDKRADAKRDAGRDPALSWLKELGYKHLNRESFGILMAGNSTFRRMFTEDLWAAENSVNTDLQRGADARKAAVGSVGLEWGSNDVKKWSATTSGEKATQLTIKLTNGRELTGTYAEWGNLYNVLTDSGARRNILAGAPVKFTREQATGQAVTLTRDDVQIIERQLPKPIKDVFTHLKEDWRDRVTPADRRAHREHKGFDLPRVDGYWHTQREVDKAGMDKQMATTAIARLGRDPQYDGAWQLRDEKAVKAPYLIEDGFAHHADMVRAAAIRTHMTRPLRNLRAVLNDKRINTALTRKFGDGFPKLAAEFVEDARLITENPNPVGALERGLVRPAQRNVSRILQVSVSATLKNLGGIFKLLPQIPAKYLVRALRDVVSRKTRERMMQSPYFRHRLEQSASLRASAALGESSDVLGPSRKRDLARRIGRGGGGELIDRLPMFPWGDARPAVVAWRAFELMADDKLKGASEAARQRWIERRAERAVRRSQNPSSTMDMSRAAIRNRGTLKGTMLMFTSDNNTSLNQLVQARMQYGYGSREFARAAAGVALNNAWAAGVAWLLRYGIRNLAAWISGNDEDDELAGDRERGVNFFAKEFMSNTFGLVYGGNWVYDLGRAAWDGVMTPERQASPDLSFSPLSRTLGSGIENGLKSIRAAASVAKAEDEKQEAAAYDRLWKALLRGGTDAAVLSGLPVSAPIGLVRPLVRGVTSTPDRDVVINRAHVLLTDTGGTPEKAARPLVRYMLSLKEEDRDKAWTSLRRGLLRKDPLFKLTGEQLDARLEALGPEKKQKAEERMDAWELRVDGLLEEVENQLNQQPAPAR